IISSQLNQNRDALCLIAHNGLKFDFPILENLFKDLKLIDQLPILYKLDSLRAFQHIDKSTDSKKSNNLSYRLEEIYYRIFGSTLLNGHTSETDVEAMLKCAQRIGEPFQKYVISNCQPFVT
ncbi:MAG: nucleic acid binding, partial [Paramarteilia canceri]